MPRRKSEINRNANLGGDGTDTAVDSWSDGGISSVPRLQTSAGRSETAREALHSILTRDDGWLRVVPHEHGGTSYWKWKFTRGPWKGYYVMVRMDKPDFEEPMWLLEQKLLQVDQGERRPAMDTFHDPL